jgi:hypothetical protein
MDCCRVLVTEPAAQVLHTVADVAPTTIEKVPDGHPLHGIVAFDCGEKRPAAHAVHEVPPG